MVKRWGALGVLLLAGATWANPPRPPPTPRIWHVPGALQVVDVPEHVWAMGVPVGIHAIKSSEKPDALEGWFRKQFKDAGLFLPPPWALSQATTATQVTGLDPDTGIVYTVFLQPNADGTTTAVVSEAYLGQAKKDPEKVTFAPLMPGASHVVQSHTEGADLLYYSVKSTLEDVKKFHEQTLGGAGYKQVEPGMFQNQDDLLRVSAEPRGNGEVLVEVIHRRAPNGPVQPPNAP